MNQHESTNSLNKNGQNSVSENAQHLDKKATDLKLDKQVYELPESRGFWGLFFYSFGILASKTFAKLKFYGRENIPKSGNYVLAPNHQCYVDGLLVFMGLPREDFKDTCAMVGDDMRYAHGIFGYLATKAGRPIYVNRKGNPVKGLIAAKKAIQSGLNVLIHPEGTRTHDGLLGNMYDGASYLSRRGKVPLIPVYIAGAYDCFSRYDKWPKFRDPSTGRRTKISITFGKALNPNNFQSNAEMTEALKSWYEEHEAKFFKDRPNARAAELYRKRQGMTRAN